MMDKLRALGTSTFRNINRAVAPSSQTRKFAFSKDEFIFKLNNSEQNAPDPIKKMQSHGGTGVSKGDGTYDVYLLTHNPPIGIPSVKIDNIDYKGNNKPQYLSGPFNIRENDISFSGVSDSISAPKSFSQTNISLADQQTLNAIRNYFTNVDREEIRMAVMSTTKLTIDTMKQLGAKIINYK